MYSPNDVYKIWKRGSAVRMDYSLTGFKSFRITRGHVSFVFTGQEQRTSPLSLSLSPTCVLAHSWLY